MRAVSSATYLAMRKLEKRLGGRDVIARALLLSEDPLMHQAGELLADPTLRTTTIQTLLKRIDPTLTFGKLLRAYAKGRADEAYAATIDQIAQKLPETAEHLMATSIPHEVECGGCLGSGMVAEGGVVKCADESPGCPQCRGTGSFRAQVPCLRCSGSGAVKRDPETERIKLALQAGGLLGTGGVTVNNTQVNQKVEATFVQTSSAFRSATDKLLWGGPAQKALEGVVDAEVFPALVSEEEGVVVE